MLDFEMPREFKVQDLIFHEDHEQKQWNHLHKDNDIAIVAILSI